MFQSPDDGGGRHLRNVGKTSAGLHSAENQKTETFIINLLQNARKLIITCMLCDLIFCLVPTYSWCSLAWICTITNRFNLNGTNEYAVLSS